VAARRRLPAVSGFCHTHYGAVLTAAGRWAEADTALTQAVAAWGLGQRSALRRGAIARLAELRVRQGRFEEAAQLLAEVAPAGETALATASIQLATGAAALAAETVARGLGQLDAGSIGAVPLLDLLVDIHLAVGDVPSASATAEQVKATADRHPSSYLTACAAFARGRVSRVGGQPDALSCLREAVAGFGAAEMPMELARARLELGTALAETNPAVATDEARAALAGFERLRAARHVDAAVALLRSLGVRIGTAVRTDGRLTNREAEVLELLGHGLSNPQIAERLFISRKTVEHHVGNILGKLGLRSRAEAAAYATRTGK
jgi:DNA-binding NarL/FixJ family response regulator